MKATELRIGNCVHGKYSTPKLFQWQSDDFDFYKHRMDDIEPIPLTEEWLVRFGFEKTESNDENESGTEYQLLDQRITLYFDGVVYGSRFEPISILTYKYVHSLQNVHYALTGEELELKP